MSKYDLKIPLKSGIVNGFVYLIIDILCLWAIHRGLMAIQAYCIIRKVKNNEAVRLKRSTIPIVSGELLEWNKSWRRLNWLVLTNLVSIVVAFVISLGINGETIEITIPISTDKLAYRTSLVGGNDTRRWYYAQPIVTRCKLVENDTVLYYPMAFNVEANEQLEDLQEFSTKSGRVQMINGTSTVCQWDAAPLIPITDCFSCDSSLFGDSVGSTISFYNRSESETLAAANNVSSWWDEAANYVGDTNNPLYIRTIKSSSTEDMREGDRLVCLEKRRVSRNPTTNTWFFCIVIREKRRSTERILTFGYFEETSASLDSATHKFWRQSSFGTVTNISHFNIDSGVFHTAIQRIDPMTPYSLVDIVDRIYYYNVMAKHNTHATQQKLIDITVIKPAAWVSMILLAILAVLIGPSFEILMYLSRRQYGDDLAKLMNVNRYDTLSTLLPRFLSLHSLPDDSTHRHFRYPRDHLGFNTYSINNKGDTIPGEVWPN